MTEPWPLTVTFFVCVFLVAMGGLGILFALLGIATLIALAGIVEFALRRRRAAVGGIFLVVLMVYVFAGTVYALLDAPIREVADDEIAFLR